MTLRRLWSLFPFRSTVNIGKRKLLIMFDYNKYWALENIRSPPSLIMMRVQIASLPAWMVPLRKIIRMFCCIKDLVCAKMFAGGMPSFQCIQTKRDTKHEDLRELLNAESFSAFPPGFAFVACLWETNAERDSSCKIHVLSLQKETRSVVHYPRLLTGLSSPSNTSSFVKSLKQSLRVTSPEFFCGDTEHVQSGNSCRKSTLLR